MLAYNSQSARDYFQYKGMLNQVDKGRHGILGGAPGHYPCTPHKCPTSTFRIQKSLSWWLLFLHTPRQHLEKFILDTDWMLRLRQMFYDCLAVSDIEVVLPAVNYERNRCRGANRQIAGCTESVSIHGWAKLCLPLDRLVGTPFKETERRFYIERENMFENI